MATDAQKSAEIASPFDGLYFDIDEERAAPVRHRYVHGGFTSGATRFSLYLPPAADYRGRFFQYITPVPLSEHLSQEGSGEEDKISFAVESGAILVEGNSGGPATDDPTNGAFRANAAIAGAARSFAEKAYGPHQTYGYAFGGSGGAFRTIAGAENTSGVWDGFVPYVVGSPMALPNLFTIRLHAARVLRDALPGIVDALEPGGNGDPYAGLTDEQAGALLEASRMGFPQRSWFAHRTMGMHAFAVIYPILRMVDPSYFEEFWTLPGYLGSDPDSSVHRDRLIATAQIEALLSAAQLDALKLGTGPHPGASTGGADDGWMGEGAGEVPAAVRLTGAANAEESELILASGARLVVLHVRGGIAVLGPADDELLRSLRIGDEVVLDNSGLLAAQTYHRHQMPDNSFAVWDQFRRADGSPIYPQRPRLLGPMLSLGATGALQTGRWNGKMIIVESLLDREAFPWQADWYRHLVERNLGELTDSRLRVWMVDNALHGDFEQQEHPDHTVSYLGVLHEALRQLAAWVEDDEDPAPSTRYAVADGAVTVPVAALDRGGVQPTIELTVDGSDRAHVSVGDTVLLRASAETPGIGKIMALEWDTAGSGVFELEPTVPGTRSNASRAVIFDAPGTYFPTVRVVSHSSSTQLGQFARLQNIARARVVVSE